MYLIMVEYFFKAKNEIVQTVFSNPMVPIKMKRLKRMNDISFLWDSMDPK